MVPAFLVYGLYFTFGGVAGALYPVWKTTAQLLSPDKIRRFACTMITKADEFTCGTIPSESLVTRRVPTLNETVPGQTI